MFRSAIRPGFIVFTVILLQTAVGFAQRDLRDIPPPDPEEERKSFLVADGFEVNLFAADPVIAKPIQMNFDPQGRLWIVSSELYPHIEPGQAANDKVLILQDLDGDGRSDRTTIFADGLLIPTGVAPGDGGAYVANSTELLHLRDADGDGRADERRIVLSGFGTEDTHHILHTLRWGPDGRLYFNQSIYIHSHIETPWGVRRLGGGGIWQFEPKTLRLEVVMRGMYNSWGHHFDAFGQSFVTDGANGEGINYSFPGAAFPSAVGVPRILHGLNPGSPKHCGLEIVSGRHLPDDWQGNMLTNDFRGHRVCRFAVTENGAGYASRELPELLKTTHVSFRPVDVKMGPDGAIYVADWYSPIIQHGEVDFRDPRRDHTHGRIWRIARKDRPLVDRPRLTEVQIEALLEHLKSPEMWTREQARRVLCERADETRLALDDWLTRLDPAAAEFEAQRLEALWVQQSIHGLSPDLLRSLLTARDGRIRAAATRVLAQSLSQLGDAAELLRRQVHDDHPRVRLEAVRGLSLSSHPRAAAFALEALDHPLDEWLDYALWLTVRELQSSWLSRVLGGEEAFGGKTERLIFALRSSGAAQAAAPLVRLIASGKLDASTSREALEVVAAFATADDLRTLLSVAVRPETAPEDRAAILRVLVQARTQRKLRPLGNLDGIENLLASDSEPVRIQAALCIGAWQHEALRADLMKSLQQPETTPEFRDALLTSLAALGGIESRKIFEELSSERNALPIRIDAVCKLAEIDLGAAAARAAEVLSGMKSVSAELDAPLTRLYGSFLQRKNGAGLLVDALAKRSLQPDIARIGLRAIDATGRSQPELEAALKTAGQVASGPRILTPDEMQQMLRDIAERGDPARGEAVFRRESLACQKCHAIAGAGGRVGPDLLSLGTSAQLDYLVDSLLQPNKAVKENFNTLVVATVDGRIFSGVKVRQSNNELVLRDAEDREVSIPAKSIEEQSAGASLMPAGLVEKLTRGELMDLVRFLSELGKVGPFAVEKGPVVRRWEVLQSTEESRYVIRRTRHATAASDNDAFLWKPAYGKVSGELPLDGLPEVSPNRLTAGSPGTAFLRCDFDVSRAGEIGLRFRSIDGLSAWIDQTPLEPGPEIQLPLSNGRHRLTLAVDLSTAGTGLRVEFFDVAGSQARAQPVGGK